MHGIKRVLDKWTDHERRVPLDVKVEAETDCGTYVRRLITYQSEPNSRTPA